MMNAYTQTIENLNNLSSYEEVRSKVLSFLSYLYYPKSLLEFMPSSRKKLKNLAYFRYTVLIGVVCNSNLNHYPVLRYGVTDREELTMF
jgi:hypothetical protein